MPEYNLNATKLEKTFDGNNELTRITELSKLSITAYSKKHGKFWRYAVLINLLSLYEIVRIIRIDQEELAMVIDILSDQENTEQVVLQSIHDLISKLCLVHVKITDYYQKTETGKKYFLISLKYR
ncbi:MAG: hypothetical protein ACFFD4_37205 [Candidatus Odinarchaeota archaeon]